MAMARSKLAAACVLLLTLQQHVCLGEEVYEHVQRTTGRFPTGIWRDITTTPQRKGLTIPQQRHVLGTSIRDRIPSPRYGHTTTVWEERKKLFLFGGIGVDQALNEWGYFVDGLSDLWEYDIEGMLWTHRKFPAVDFNGDGVAEPVSPTGRFYHASFQMDHKMYVYGGLTVATIGPAITNKTYWNDFWVFDPTKGFYGGWTDLSSTTNAPPARHSATFSSFREHVYLFGGKNATTALPELHHYSTDTGVWNQVVPEGGVSPPGRHGHSSAILSDENMYIFGGTDNNGQILSDLWRYKINTNTWLKLETAPVWPAARTGHGGVGKLGVGMSSWHSNRGKLATMVVYGGWAGNNSYHGDVWEFTPGPNRWHYHDCSSESHTCPASRAPTARWKMGLAAFHNLTTENAYRGTSLFVFGGSIEQIGRGSGTEDFFRYYS